MAERASRTEQTVRELMTPAPHSVTVDYSVADALRRMHALGIRHLPVTAEGQVVGILREPELATLCQHGQADGNSLAVGEVLNPQRCLLADPEMPLAVVVQSMAVGKSDCCAVVERGHLTGIVTSHDLIEHLSRMLLDPQLSPSLRPSPSELRVRILGEHAILRQLFAEIDEQARAVLQGEGDQMGALHVRCRELYQTLIQHMELENSLLAPALRDCDAFGPMREEQLLSEHARQRRVLFNALAASEERAGAELARGVVALIAELRIDMAYEEQSLLDPDLLKDDPITVNASTG